ncbi:SIMPL domain-containing protein [Pseudomonas seleniipraecipitans]|uniref:SIMPL domain-containing protein n=1 Tax=Phytopseudomonas seleniipraecipitans TaxID=640205 RepID=A0ABY5JBZ2_9GAMM|nr:SIMPL domain-containing protein [Pseudomonas seleniipraecipitans]UUD65572.1 SIMPL domain-containing protein [Pseudomonas seleniipraecipitans]
MQPLSRLAIALAFTTAGLLSVTAHAEEPRYNQISLSTQVSHEVAHDLMQVTLYTEAQNQDPAALAAEITRTLNAGLAQARGVQGVTVSQGSRNSYPVYSEKGEQISAWRERAEIRLESADFAALSKLTGDMLKTLKMGGMSFSIADATRKKEEDALIKDAVTAFKERAQLTTEALGGSTYKLVSLNLNSGGFVRPPMRMEAMKAASFASDSVTPDVEAGTSQVTMNSDGVIEVQMP